MGDGKNSNMKYTEQNWLNNKVRIHKADEIEKPCHECGFCPYGGLVEEYPLHPEYDHEKVNLNEVNLNTGFNCLVFGHDCPVFYQGEFITEN